VIVTTARLIVVPNLPSVLPVTVQPHVAVRVKTSVASPSCRATPVTAMAAHVVMPAHSVLMLAVRTTVHRMVPHAVPAARHAARNHAVTADVRQATLVMLVQVSVRTAIAKAQVVSAWMASSAASVLMATVQVAARLFKRTNVEVR
jgi:hypothetical protein